MQTDTLVRKQFFLSTDNIAKLERLAKQLKGGSAAKIVRDAIDAYNPNSNQAQVEQKELLELAHSRVKEAIAATDKANQTMDICLESLSKKENH
jgi:flagellar hook-basal body complex protein FliE